MTDATRARVEASAVAVAPALMLAGFLAHPSIGNPTDPEFLARLGSAVEAVPLQWAIAHLLVALGSGVILLAFLVIRARLREAGENRWSARAVPFIAMGSILYALPPAMEFGPLAAMRAGFDPAAVQGALFPWFVPVIFSAAVLFLIGAVGFAKAFVRSGILPAGPARVAAVALLVMAGARLVPFSVVHFQVQAFAGLLALWPVAWVLWSQPDPSGSAVAGSPERAASGAAVGA